MSSVPLYDHFSADYDRFVEWEGRLAYEWPFLERQLRAAGARRVLDAACGTGRHTIALARAGYQVVGSDLSAGMIAVARQNAAAARTDVQFIVAGFGQHAGRLAEPFDAALCLGNSLPHALSAEALLEALRDFRAVLRPGGLLIVQNRNFDLVWKTRERFMPVQAHREDDREWLFVRFYDFGPATITFNMLTLRRQGGDWEMTHESTELRPIFRGELEAALGQAGFTSIEFYGSLTEEAFDAERSGNLVAVARAA